MPNNIFHKFVSAFSIRLMNNFKMKSIQLLKIEITKGYLRGVKAARLSVIGLMGLGLIIAVICIGVMLVHIGLFILLPWTLKAKAILGICLGLTYVVICGLLLRAVLNEKMWLERSGAAKLLKATLPPKTEPAGTWPPSNP